MSKNSKYENNNSILIAKIALLNIFSTSALAIIFMAITSFLIIQLDLATEYAYYFSFTTAICVAFFNGFIFSKIIHTNKIIVGIVSNVLFIIFLIAANLFVDNNNSILLFVLKLILVTAFGALGGLFNVKKKRKFKIK